MLAPVATSSRALSVVRRCWKQAGILDDKSIQSYTKETLQGISMYYTRFRIQNCKGIRDTTIKWAEQSKVAVFAFVGLNESGKTTILFAVGLR